ncbi:transposase [Streptomyces sp. GMR22]|uniref:transposase n=1 Tax=Streptomyces sp. GMR22 TaxID=2759524 RepID=UPI0022792EDA|nr:transposase [Streptomyces sp. GMR22]
MRQRRYPSDTTNAEWALLEPLLPEPACETSRGGRPEKHPRREIVDAIRYVVDTGCKWRALPADFLLVTWNQAPQDAPRILRRPHVLRRTVGQRGGAGGEVAGPGPAQEGGRVAAGVEGSGTGAPDDRCVRAGTR